MVGILSGFGLEAQCGQRGAEAVRHSPLSASVRSCCVEASNTHCRFAAPLLLPEDDVRSTRAPARFEACSTDATQCVHGAVETGVQAGVAVSTC